VVLVVGRMVVLVSDRVAELGAGAIDTGFCHTDGAVGAPRVGNKLTRIAYTAPAAPAVTIATIANTDANAANRRPGETWAGPSCPTSGGPADNTVGSRDASAPCPPPSQSPLTS
jgi:hypothetical protein